MTAVGSATSAIAAVFRREWAAYFRTPVGWAVLALFLVLKGLVFWLFIRFLGRPDAPPGGVMEFFFGGTILYWIALALLATVVPMRLIAEERRTGTIEPLLTAPVTPAEVVVGKWLAALAFYATAWAPTLTYVAYLRLMGGHLDPGPVVSGYLGTLLLGGAALAIGVCASALTRNQVVAATLSFVSFFVALLAGAAEAQTRNASLGALLRRGNPFRMMEDFGHGIVDSRDLVSLPTITVLALAAAAALVGRSRGPLPEDAPPRSRLAARVTPPLAIAIAFMVNHLAGRHYLRADWTGDGLYRLSERTVAVLEGLPRPVEVTVFRYPNRQGERARAVAALLRELLERAAAHGGGRFRFTIVDPDREPTRAEAAAKRYGIDPYTMNEGAVLLTSGTHSKVLSDDDLLDPEVASLPEGAETGEAVDGARAWRGEASLVSALLTVTSDNPIRVCFSTGHGEPDPASTDDGGYATFAGELRADGDEVRAVTGLAEAASQSCRVLVIAEPTQAFGPTELAALRSFLDGGGALLAMVGPVFDSRGTSFAHTGLEAVAAERGAVLVDNLVVDPAHASDVEGPSVWAATGDNYAMPRHPALRRFGDRLTYWPRTREVAPVEATSGPGSRRRASALVRSSAEAWGETDLATIRGEADLTFDPPADRKGPLPVAVAVERLPAGAARAQPSAVFLGTGRLVMNYRLGGALLRDYDADFVRSLLAWLTDREVRAGVSPKVPARLGLAPTQAEVSWAFRLFVLAVPAAVLAAGAIVWTRRRV